MARCRKNTLHCCCFDLCQKLFCLASHIGMVLVAASVSAGSSERDCDTHIRCLK